MIFERGEGAQNQHYDSTVQGVAKNAIPMVLYTGELLGFPPKP
mgnify:CR=1 FL=1